MGEEVGTFSRGGVTWQFGREDTRLGAYLSHISLNIPSPTSSPPPPKKKKNVAYLLEFWLLIHPGHYSRPRELDDNAYASFFFREVGENGANKQISWNVLIRGLLFFRR